MKIQISINKNNKTQNSKKVEKKEAKNYRISIVYKLIQAKVNHQFFSTCKLKKIRVDHKL